MTEASRAEFLAAYIAISGDDNPSLDDRAYPILNARKALRLWKSARASVVVEWQPIETAPRDGTIILIGCSDADEMVATSTAGRWIDGEEDGIDYMGSDGGFCDVDFSLFYPARSFGAEKSRYEGLQPTHWMPLPAPPSSQQGRV